MSFSSLGLTPEILRALEEQGYERPTPIQAQAIPVILEGHDLMASAQTGTGKTAAFTLPLLQRLSQSAIDGPRRVRALVLTPTRELAAQVGESVRDYGRHLDVHSAVVFGGVTIGPQITRLKHGVDILVATPGRLMDHLGRGTVRLSQVEALVLDEADRMLDMGFLPAIERIVASLPARRQTLLFSATFSGPIRTLAQRFLSHPRSVEVARPNSASAAVRQSAYFVDAARKRELLSYLIGSQDWRQVLVFTRTKRGADRLARQLEKDGIDAAAIHGDKSQGARTRALAAFKGQGLRALVATDIAARGIDIDELPHVVNYDLPANPEDYVHRIGRTGRGGQTGSAISLVCADEHGQFDAIKRLLKAEIPTVVQSGFEPTASPVHRDSAPKRPARSGNRGHPGNERVDAPGDELGHERERRVDRRRNRTKALDRGPAGGMA